MLLGELVMVDAEDDREVSTIGRSRNDDALGASRQVSGSLVAGGEDARAFHRDIDAQFPMGKGSRVLNGGNLDRLAVADGDRVAFDRHGRREAAMDGVVTEQVGVGLDRAEVVDGDDFDIGAAGFDDGAKNVAADTSETVDGNLDCHVHSLPRGGAC